MFTKFALDYYGVDPLTVSNFVDIITYKEEFPVFYFDVSKQSQQASQCVVDIKIRMRFAENVGANVVAYALSYRRWEEDECNILVCKCRPLISTACWSDKLMMMEEELQKLAEYAEPKPKSFICMSGNKSRLKTSFIPPFEFPPSYRYEMALTSLETYNSFLNIDASNNHLKVSLDGGKTWMDIHIPTGCYEIKAIDNELQRFIMKNRV